MHKLLHVSIRLTQQFVHSIFYNYTRMHVCMHVQVFAKVIKKPSGQSVGVLDLYFDCVGSNKVCDLLITKGLFLSSTPSTGSAISCHVTTPTSGHVTPPSLLSRLVKNSGKQTLPAPAQIFNGVKVSVAIEGMPSLENCSLSDSNQSDVCCRSNGGYHSNKFTTTSGYHSVSEDEDW